MAPETIMLTVLTHPFQVLLMGIILIRLAREVVAAATQARGMEPGSHPAPAADLSERRVA